MKKKDMLDELLSATERQEAALVLEKYRKKYMCGMGPFLGKVITKAIESDAGREALSKLTEQFFNSTYFNNISNDGLPQNTRTLLGFNVWQTPCKVEHIRRLNDSQILTGFVSGNINASIDDSKIDKIPGHLDFFVKRKDDKDRDVLMYPYVLECVFSSSEQAFMFIRAFWYFIEARVLFHLVGGVLDEQTSGALGTYTELRRSLISPFIHDQFPERHYYTKVNVTTASELETFYDKFLFSKLRIVQRKALIIARVIARG
nr:hypothetical protein [Candidatus Sigynarchaeum springense]MDO8118481.1 hypothetical protein [Candidatus Sigynarchaeota archaeon]